jgi:ADP-heptose:LPS heptosyltransferase
MNVKKHNPRILIIMFGRIGDLLLTTAVPAELKRILPDCKVYFLLKKEFYNVLSLNPLIDEIICLEKNLFSRYKTIRKIRQEKFNYVFDFQSNPGSAIITLLSGAEETFGYHFDFRIRNMFYRHTVKRDSTPMYAVENKFSLVKSAGLNPENYRTYFFFSDNDKAFAMNKIKEFELEHKRFCIFSTTSRKTANRWLPEYFAELSKILYKSTGIVPLFIYGPSEEEYVRNIYNMCREVAKILPPLTLKQAGALVSMADFVLGVDNGLKHLAVAVGTPTFTIFGPSQPEHWTPPEKKHAWIRADIDCIECFKRSCDDLKCMKVLTPDIVLNKLLQFLHEEIKIKTTKS